MADEWKTLLAKSQRDIEKALESDFSGADQARKDIELRASLEEAKYKRSPEYMQKQIDSAAQIEKVKAQAWAERDRENAALKLQSQKDLHDYTRKAARAGITKVELDLMLGEFDSIPNKAISKAMRGWAGNYVATNKRYPSQREKAAKLAEVRRAFSAHDAGGDPSKSRMKPAANPDRSILESAGMALGDVAEGVWDIGAGLLGGLGGIGGELLEGDIGGAASAGGEMAKAVAKGALVEGPGQLGAAVGSFAGGAAGREGGPIDKLRAGFHELADYLTQGADEAQIRQGMEQGAGLSDEAVAFLGYANDVLSAVPGIDKMDQGEVEDWFVKTMSEDPNSAGIILDLLGAGVAGKGGAKALRRMGVPDRVLAMDPAITGRFGPQNKGDLDYEFVRPDEMVPTRRPGERGPVDHWGVSDVRPDGSPIQQLAGSIDPERLAEAPEPVLRALEPLFDADDASRLLDDINAGLATPDAVAAREVDGAADAYAAAAPDPLDVGSVASEFDDLFRALTGEAGGGARAADEAAKTELFSRGEEAIRPLLDEFEGVSSGKPLKPKKKTVRGAGDVKPKSAPPASDVLAEAVAMSGPGSQYGGMVHIGDLAARMGKSIDEIAQELKRLERDGVIQLDPLSDPRVLPQHKRVGIKDRYRGLLSFVSVRKGRLPATPPAGQVSRLFLENPEDWKVGHGSSLILGRDETVVYLDPRAVMEATNDSQRLLPDGSNQRVDGDGLGRLDKAIAFFESGRKMPPPEVGFMGNSSKLGFTNGRHRTLAAQMLGEEAVPFVVKKREASKLEDIFGVGPSERKVMRHAGHVETAKSILAKSTKEVSENLNKEMAADPISALDKIGEAAPAVAAAISTTDELLGVTAKSNTLKTLPFHSKFSTFRKMARDLGFGPVIDRIAELQHWSSEATNSLVREARRITEKYGITDADDRLAQEMYATHRKGSSVKGGGGGYSAFAKELRAAGKGHIVKWYDEMRSNVFERIRKMHGIEGRDFYFPAHLWHEPPIVGASRFSAVADNFRVGDLSRRLLPQRDFKTSDLKASRYWIEDYIRGEVNKVPGGRNQATHLVAEWLKEIRTGVARSADGTVLSRAFDNDALAGIRQLEGLLAESIGEFAREPSMADSTFASINKWLVPKDKAAKIAGARSLFEEASAKLGDFMREKGNELELVKPGDTKNPTLIEFNELVSDLSSKKRGLESEVKGTAHQFIYDFFGRDPISSAFGTVMGTFVTSVLGWRPLIHGPMQALDVMSLGPILTSSPMTIVDGIKSLAVDVVPTIVRDMSDKIGFSDPVLRTAYDNVGHLHKLISGDDTVAAYQPGRAMPDAWESVGPMVKQDRLYKNVRGDSLAARASEKLGYIAKKHDRVALAGLEYFEEVLNKTSVRMADAHFQRMFRKHGNNAEKLVDSLSPLADDATKAFWKKLGEKNPVALRNEFARWYTVETFVGRTNFDRMIMYSRRAGATDLSRFADFQRSLFTRHPATRLGQLFQMVDAGLIDPKKAFWMATSATGGMLASYAIMRSAMPFETDEAALEKTIKYGSSGVGYDLYQKVSGGGIADESILHPKNIHKAVPVIAQASNAYREILEPATSNESLLSGRRKKFLGMTLPAGAEDLRRRKRRKKREQ